MDDIFLIQYKIMMAFLIAIHVVYLVYIGIKTFEYRSEKRELSWFNYVFTEEWGLRRSWKTIPAMLILLNTFIIIGHLTYFFYNFI